MRVQSGWHRRSVHYAVAEQRQHRRNAQFQQREKGNYNSATLPSCTSAVSPGLMPCGVNYTRGYPPPDSAPDNSTALAVDNRDAVTRSMSRQNVGSGKSCQ